MLPAFTHRSETHRSDLMRPLLVHHVAQLLGVSPRTVRHLASNGSLEGFKLPGQRALAETCWSLGGAWHFDTIRLHLEL